MASSTAAEGRRVPPFDPDARTPAAGVCACRDSVGSSMRKIRMYQSVDKGQVSQRSHLLSARIGRLAGWLGTSRRDTSDHGDRRRRCYRDRQSDLTGAQRVRAPLGSRKECRRSHRWLGRRALRMAECVFGARSPRQMWWWRHVRHEEGRLRVGAKADEL